jgi:hypothetical protein
MKYYHSVLPQEFSTIHNGHYMTKLISNENINTTYLTRIFIKCVLHHYGSTQMMKAAGSSDTSLCYLPDMAASHLNGQYSTTKLF